MNSLNKTQDSPLETLHVNSKKISCEGGSKISGHPLVYLDMGKDDSIICPYCSKFFTIRKEVGRDTAKEVRRALNKK